MGDVPTLQQNIPSIALPNVQLQQAPDIGGGQSAPPMEKTLNMAIGLYKEQLNDINHAIVLENDMKLDYAASDITRRMQQKYQGSDALKATTEGMKEWQKVVEDVQGGLNGDNQKMSVGGRITLHGGNLRQALEQYGMAETQRYKVQTQKAWLDNAGHTASAADIYLVPEKYKMKMDEIKANLNTLYGNNPAVAIDEFRKINDEINKDGIMNLITTGHSDIAQNLYDERQGTLSTKTKTEIEEKLHPAISDAQGIDIGMKAWYGNMPVDSTGKVNYDAPVDVFKMLQQAKKDAGNDPKKYEAARAFINENAAAFNKSQSEYESANKSAVWGVVADGATWNNVSRMREYSMLKGEERNRVKDAFTKKDEKLTADQTVEQTIRWNELNDNNALLQSTNLDEELSTRKIDKAQYKKLVEEKKNPKPLKAKNVANAMLTLKEAFKSSMFDPTNAENNKAVYEKAVSNFKDYVINNSSDTDGTYDPLNYVDKILEHKKRTWLDHQMNGGSDEQDLRDWQNKITASGEQSTLFPVPANTRKPVNVPQKGAVSKGYRFKGGNPADKNNWEKVD